MQLTLPRTGTLSTTVPTVNHDNEPLVRVALIGCSKTKLDGRHRARDLYIGPLFKASLGHATHTADELFVLSSVHGLLALDQEVDSYDRPLRSASKSERDNWAYRACLDLRRRMRGRRFEVVIYAGETYADPIEKYLRLLDCSIAVTAPLSGLTLGYQLRWFRIAAAMRGCADVAR
jgi:hypothetical protein